MTTLLGGEMLLWSDLDGTHGPAPAGGPTLSALLAFVRGRTLVAGPHDPALLDALPPGDVTVLLRGAADADALAARRPDLTVWCGSLDKVAAVPAYDTVVALDGLDRLISAEAEDRPWDETLGLLTALLRPGGRLLLGAENTFGLHRLVGLPAALSDADWVLPEQRTLAELTARLEVARTYAAYPGLAAPSVLLSPAMLAEAPAAGFVAAALSAAGPTGDAVRLATGALRHGLAAELAPAWFIVAGPVDGLPDAVLDGRAIDLTEVPRGRTLADLLLSACRRRDLPAVRQLLSGWLAGPAAGVPADQVVIEAGGHPVALAPAGPPLAALRRFAASLTHGGEATLWPSGVDEAGLTAVLAGMTGREVTPAEIPPAPADSALPGVRELLSDRDRLTRELVEARARHEWYEQTLRSRETELKRVNAILAASEPARALLGGLRAARRVVRRVRR
jgi:hypothetical protein